LKFRGSLKGCGLGGKQRSYSWIQFRLRLAGSRHQIDIVTMVTSHQHHYS